MTSVIFVSFSADINECMSYPCGYGSCVDMVDEFTCECDSGYMGTLCDSETFITSVLMNVNYLE